MNYAGIIMFVAFAVPLLYVRYKTGKFHSSISIIYYEKDFRLLWKLTILTIAYIASTYHNIMMDWAAISILGVAVFPDINIKRIKRIHDSFAMAFFALAAFYVSPYLLLGMTITFIISFKFISLYWIEWIGMIALTIGLTLKEIL